MNTTDTRPCGGCGEPASAHPVLHERPDLAERQLLVERRDGLGHPADGEGEAPEARRRFVGIALQEALLNEALDANLRARREMFAAGAAVNERLHSTMRIGDTSADPEALIYALGSFKSFVPKELSDANGRRWHLVLEPESPEDASRKGFAIFRELGPNDDCVPSEELLDVLRGKKDFGNIVAHERFVDFDDALKQIEQARRERDEAVRGRAQDGEMLGNWSASFRDIAIELFPDAPDELMQVPLEDAVTSCLGRIKALRKVEAERDLSDGALRDALQRVRKIQGEWSKANTELNTAAVERDRARQERDNARAQLEAQLLTVDQTTSLAYALGCERVGTPRLGDTMIAVATALKKDAKEHGRVNTAKSELGAALGIDDAGHTWDGLLDRVRGLAEKPPGRFATPSHVLLEARLLEARLADVEARIGQPGPLDALAQRLEKLERSDAEWEPMLDRRDVMITKELKQLADRVAEIETQVGAVEAAGTAFISTHRKQQQEIAALEPLFKSVHDAVKDALGRIDKAVESMGAIRLAGNGVRRRVDILEAWRTRVSKQFGPNAEGGPVNGAMLADMARIESERDAALDELKRGKYTPLAELRRGDWVVFDGAPREVVGLSPAEVVLDVRNAPVRIDRTGPALHLVWRPGPRE